MSYIIKNLKECNNVPVDVEERKRKKTKCKETEKENVPWHVTCELISRQIPTHACTAA